MSATLITQMEQTLLEPMEAILIQNWTDENRTQIGKIIPQSDNLYNSEVAKQKFNWKTTEEFLNLTQNQKDLNSIIFIAQEDFPQLAQRMTANQMLKMALPIIKREGKPMNRLSLEMILTNLNMEFNYL